MYKYNSARCWDLLLILFFFLCLTDGNLAEVCRLSPQRRSPVLSRKNRESEDPCFVARLLALLVIVPINCAYKFSDLH